DGAAPTLREAVPTTRPAAGRQRRGPGRAAVRHALAAAAGALVALLAVAPVLGGGRRPEPEPPGGGAPNTQPAASDELEVGSVRLTYGPSGSPRPDHTVLPGDQIDLEFAVRGAGKNRKDEAHLTLDGEVVDPNGKRVDVVDPK